MNDLLREFWDDTAESLIRTVKIIAVLIILIQLITLFFDFQNIEKQIFTAVILRAILILYVAVLYFVSVVKRDFFKRNYQILAAVGVIYAGIFLSIFESWSGAEYYTKIAQLEIIFVVFIPVSIVITVFTVIFINLFYVIHELAELNWQFDKAVWQEIHYLAVFAGIAIVAYIILHNYRFNNFLKRKELQEKARQINKQKTELENLNKNLREAVAAKDKFFSIIAHDLRSSLSGVINTSDILSDRKFKIDRKERTEFIKTINRAARFIYNLLENLLDWTRIRTDRIEFNPEDIILKDTIENNVALFKMNVENKKIKIFLDIKDAVICYGDPNMISTVLRNLISNAVKFTGEGGEIRISGKETGNFVEIEVMDNGVGIPSENLGKLFLTDVTYKTKGTKNERGSGLGLLLSREFVEKNGGKIWVESEEGIGSSFKFTIPKKSY